MPQEQLTKEDEKQGADLRTTAAIGLAGLLGIPVAEAGRKQVVGAKILKMMERGDLGKDLLAKGGKAVAGRGYATSPKPDAVDKPSATTPRPRTQVKSKDVRAAASSPSLRQQIHDLVANEIETLKKVTSGVTKTYPEKINEVAANKSARRKSLTQQKRESVAKRKESVAAYNARVEKSDAAKAAAAAKRIDAETSRQVIDMNRDARLRGTGIKINEKISERLPELGKERRRLLTARSKMVKELGEKPKRGRTQASRDAVTAWDAKQQQVRAIDAQIAKLDEVIKPGGQLRVNPQMPVTQLPGAAASIIGRMPGTEPTSTFFNDFSDVAQERQRFNQDITDLGRLQRDILPFGLTPPAPIAPPQRGSMPIYGFPGMRGQTTPFAGAPETERYFDLAPEGTPRYEAPIGPEPVPTTARDAWLAKYDPAGVQALQDQFTSAVDQFDPKNVRSRYDPTGQTMTSPAERTARIMSMAAERKAGNTADPSLVDRILKMFNVTGNVSPQVATNIGNQATVRAGNAVATKKWKEANPGVTFDPANPQHVAQITDIGYKDPITARQTSLISNAANTTSSVGDITVPRTRLGMNAAAATAGESLGITKGFGSKTFNPELAVGDVNLGKLNKWLTGGSLVGTGAALGYQYLRGKQAEKDAVKSGGSTTPAGQQNQSATDPNALQNYSAKTWNTIAGKKSNQYQSGQDIYNAVLAKAMSEDWWSKETEDRRAKLKSFWATYAKQRDGVGKK